VAGRWRWVCVVLGIWAAWWLVATIWSGAELARTTVESYIIGEKTQFISDGKLAAALGNPDANTLRLLPAGVGLAPATPTVCFRPFIIYEAANADIVVKVRRRQIRVTMEYVGGGWKVAGMDILP
jgi:hypothetical protein